MTPRRQRREEPAETGPVTEVELRAPWRLKEMDCKNTLDRFALWCETAGIPAVLSKTTYCGFEEFIRGIYAPGVVKQKLRHLYNTGIASTDLATRDIFFDNFPDRRKVSDILAEPWWSAIPRILVPNLETAERNRVVRELDNFFRWRQRTAETSPEAGLQMLFLAEGISDRTKYQRLSRLCVGLDAVLPGAPELHRLRALQRSLYARVWPKAPATGSRERRVPAIEQLLVHKRHYKKGTPLSEATKKSYRNVLMLHSNIMAGVGRGLEFDRAALNDFADHVWTKLGVEDGLSDEASASGSERAADPEWSDVTAWSMCEKLAPFIPDAALQAEWKSFVRHLKDQAEQRGQVKRKERALSERPLTLEMLFRRASDLCKLADAEMNVQRRHGLHAVIGALAILLFYPLRRADLLRLRIGRELTLCNGRWLLAPKFAQKTGEPVNMLILPEEAGVLIEFCLLRGAPRAQLSEIYKSAYERPLLASPRRTDAYHEDSFSNLLFRWMRHRPHIVRSVWCDHLVALGADRATISAMLQHKSLISQEDYEILAGKIRQAKAMDALRDLAIAAMADD